MESHKTIFIPLTITLVVSALLFTSLGYYIAGGTPDASSAASTPTPASSATDTPITTVSDSTKKVDLTYFSFEVPLSWSIAYPGEFSSSAPYLSVGMKDIAYGDINWTQVDMDLEDAIVGTVVAKAQAGNATGWSKETVDGVSVDVYTYELDNGEVTKGGTGGKVYYLPLPGAAERDYSRTLVIKKQAKGDAAFEQGFQQLLTSFRFGE